MNQTGPLVVNDITAGVRFFFQKPLTRVMWIDGRLLYTWDDGKLFFIIDG